MPTTGREDAIGEVCSGSSLILLLASLVLTSFCALEGVPVDVESNESLMAVLATELLRR